MVCERVGKEVMAVCKDLSPKEGPLEIVPWAMEEVESTDTVHRHKREVFRSVSELLQIWKRMRWGW